jgi:taurine dioxygenase
MVEPIAGSLGAEVHGVDLACDLDAQTTREIRRAFLAHGVIFFRGQRLTAEHLLDVSRRFGPLCRVPYITPLDRYPDIVAVRKEAEERRISTFGGTWHSDFTFLEHPPMASVLYALEVPPHGGDTLWASTSAAYERLSRGLRRLLAGRRAMHSGHIYGAERPPLHLRTSTSIRISRHNPEADVERPHPVVRMHPETLRPALFVNPVYTTRFEGMTEAESEPLLGYLYRHATRPELTCRFRWRAGDLAIWDNRCTLHLAVNDYDGYRRELYRTTIAGERPIPFRTDEVA